MFRKGDQYSRADVKEMLGLPRKSKGGPWDTGYREWKGEYYIFSNVGVAGRTGHNYENRWLAKVPRRFEWKGKTGTRLGQPMIERMTRPDSVVHLFTRTGDRKPFTYEGLVQAMETRPTVPVTVVWEALEEEISSRSGGAEPGGRRGTGQGRSADSARNQAVEGRAMFVATELLSNEGWTVTDVSVRESFDLLCKRSGEELHVEVKGTTGGSAEVEVTANEVDHARATSPRTALVVVHGIRVVKEEEEGAWFASGGDVIREEPWDPDAGRLTPTQFRYRLRSSS